MKLIPLFLIASLLLLPLADAATYPIPITDSKLHRQNYQMIASDNYSLQVQNPPALYGLTGSNLTTIGWFHAFVGFSDQQDVTKPTHYDLLALFNGNHSLEVDFSYEPSGLWFAKTWTATRTMRYDGQELCTSVSKAGLGFFTSPMFGNHLRPMPVLSVLALRTPSDIQNNLTVSRVYYNFGDGLDSYKTSISNVCSNPAVGAPYVNTTEGITEGFNLIPTAFDGTLYNTNIFYEVYNQTKDDQNHNNSLGTLEQAACGGFVLPIVGTCIDPSLILSFIFGGMLDRVGQFLSFIPGGGLLFKFIRFPFDMMLSGVSILDDLIFNNGAPYGVGGLFWMHFVYAFTIGCVATALTGNWAHIFMFPIKLTFFSVYAIGYGAYFFFYVVPVAMLNLISSAWNALTNLFRA